jgi:quercetin dioxygenase-like cupin family protein
MSAAPPNRNQGAGHGMAIVREHLLAAALEGAPAIERVEVARIALAPLQETGRHRHPCTVVGCVVSGTIRFQVEGGEELTLRAGDAFHEPANAAMAHFDNASDSEGATFIAFYLLPPGEDRLIELLG